jgi:hypothetical protein
MTATRSGQLQQMCGRLRSGGFDLQRANTPTTNGYIPKTSKRAIVVADHPENEQPALLENYPTGKQANVQAIKGTR